MPKVSVLVAAYDVEATLERSLQCLARQSFSDFEIVVVDSSTTESCARMVQERYPAVKFRRSQERLSASVALNQAATLAGGSLLAFTDPDAYADPRWLATLVAEFDRTGQPVAGGVACHGRRWVDLGAHFCKFDKWLPGGRRRVVQEAPTVNFLVSRGQFEACGPFRNMGYHADTDLSWRLWEAGHEIRLEPRAVVSHHHLHSWGSLLVERFQRGQSFVAVWVTWNPRRRLTLLWRAVISLVPIRLVTQTVRVGRNARAAGMGMDFLATLPVLVSGLYAWLLGEAAGFTGAALKRG